MVVLVIMMVNWMIPATLVTSHPFREIVAVVLMNQSVDGKASVVILIIVPVVIVVVMTRKSWLNFKIPVVY
jgi:hypothetical protein